MYTYGMHIFCIRGGKANTKILVNVECHQRAYWCSFYDSFRFSILKFLNQMLKKKTASVLSPSQSLS